MGDPADPCKDCGNRAVVVVADELLCGGCFNGRSSEMKPGPRNTTQKTTYVEVVHAFFRLTEALGTLDVSADVATALHQLQRALHRHGVAIL